MRLLISVLLFVLGLMLGLYGLFALTFSESGSSTYVTFGSHRLDAHLVGAVSLGIGLGGIWAAVVLARRSRLRP
jgi:hypothetical protein